MTKTPRKISASAQRRAQFWGYGLSGLALVLVLPLAAAADAETEARYPYDPACDWGRVANGRGMLIRCLTEAEAHRLANGSSTTKGALPAQTQGAPAPGETQEKPPTEEPPSSKKPGKYSLKLAPIVADEGEVGLGALGKPQDRYRACVDDNGGLSKKSATVVVEFLVRGERRRAEGAEVGSFSGVSRQAADCIAQVVDRRQVGTPSVPMTGAKLTFEFKAE